MSVTLPSDTHVPARNFFETAGHLHNYSDRLQAFLQQVHYELEQLPYQPIVLDIGCGHGIGLDDSPQHQISRKAKELWGVEPDPTIQVASCFTRTWRSTLELADIPAASVDFAYSQMVLEHITEPELFLQKVASVLKPGGVFLSLTVNAQSTLARIAKACHQLRIQDAVLHLAVGKQTADEYHYPAVYRMTSRSVLEPLCAAVGLPGLQLAYLEADEWLFYFPRGTKWIGHIATRLLQRRVANYSWLLVRIEK